MDEQTEKALFRSADVLDSSENVAIVQQIQKGVFSQKEHFHEFIEIVYVAEGTGTQILSGQPYEVRRGSVVFLNYGMSHTFSSPEGMIYYDVLLQPSFMSETLVHAVDAFSLLMLSAFSDFRGSISDDSPVLQFDGCQLEELDALIRTMAREFREKESGYKTALRGYMQVLLTFLFRKMSLPVAEPASSNSMMPELLSYIQQHCCERLSLNELAAQCFYNPSYFSRMFREFSGMTLTEYIHHCRIERAVLLLQETRRPVEEIGAAVGYGDKKQFYRHFRAVTGKTPGEFRRVPVSLDSRTETMKKESTGKSVPVVICKK